jgi:hypothetical protein
MSEVEAVRMRPSMGRTGHLAAMPLLALGGLATGCGPTITAPDVVGMRLDAAHREFEALGVEKFNDRDVIGNEDAILWDASWVVVEQDPAPGTEEVDTDTTVELSVGHENDSEVLKMIPGDSPFARETTDQDAEAGQRERAEAEEPATEEDKTGDTPAAKCASRTGNAGEIYVWNSYGSDQPPDAMRLGGGHVWDFGDKKCLTTTEFALSTVPKLKGFCTEVGKVSANPGYRVNARPAPRIPNIIGQAGDC